MDSARSLNRFEDEELREATRQFSARNSARSVNRFEDKEDSSSYSLDHLEIPHEEIKLATRDLADYKIIGRVLCGLLYRENLLCSEKSINVAIKRLNAISRHGETEFMHEISMLSSFKHDNLISLLGYCDEEDERILVYEYASRRTLDRYMSAPTLSWDQRLKICLGAAKGLQYRHTGAVATRLIHRDIKSANILLDDTWASTISRLRLLKIGPTMDHTHVGTVGYLDPEYCQTGKKSDVYSFGVVLFEILCGRLAYANEGRSSSRLKLREAVQRFYGRDCVRSVNRFEDEEESSSYSLDHLRIPLEEIKLATRAFSDDNIIGCGGFGSVYKGNLSCSEESIVAIKRLNAISRHGKTEFMHEISMLSSFKHENVISLLGYCDEEDGRILVNEYASRRTLDQNMSAPTLSSWAQRLKICIGVAKALQYLHTGAEDTPIIHRDIKSANVLLDDTWSAKLSDFGLSKIGPTMHHTHVSTVGYLDPEYCQTGKKSDVYSFGVVLFEILCGRLAYANEGRSSSRLKEMKACCGRNILSRYWRDILPKIEIYITTRPGNTIALVANTSDTIRDLKLKIPPSEWNHRDLPDLFYKGEHLNDNCTLDSYNISWLSTLECRLGLNISVRTMSGKTVSVKVASSNTTISNLKAKIQDKEGVPQFQQKLFFNGRQLENKCTLADYKIEDGSTLLLVRRSKGWIPIYVKTHTGKTISLEVKSSDTIRDLKIKINEVDDILPYKQNLFLYGEQLLDNNCTLNDYNIHPESTLFLVPVCRGRMKIYVETIRGNTITLDVISRYTIGEVKSLIRDKEGIWLHEQTLVYEGQKLDDRRTLVSYLIQDETSLRLVDDTLMRPELMRIHIEIVATGKTIPLQVETFDTINSVKSKIQGEEDIPFELQRLFLPQIQLKDDFTLADYYIQNESTLHLLVTLIKIFVKKANGKIIALDVDSSDTILNVKAKIHDVEEIPRDHQTLLLAEEQLKDSFTVAKYCIKNESTLHLLVT